jgi:hypothetical protein
VQDARLDDDRGGVASVAPGARQSPGHERAQAQGVGVLRQQRHVAMGGQRLVRPFALNQSRLVASWASREGFR